MSNNINKNLIKKLKNILFVYFINVPEVLRRKPDYLVSRIILVIPRQRSSSQIERRKQVIESTYLN